MIEIYLYGRLRRYAPDARPDRESVVRVAPGEGETVGALLERVGIARDEPYHVFLNGALLSTRNTMAVWLSYQEGANDGLDVPARSGDRIGLFGRDMALLVV
ncbi:MAG: hypothetical protein JXD18_01355 [Anaerolineae bacterium]|nr:hypothetical protein [Anaerolineae bacterium]